MAASPASDGAPQTGSSQPSSSRDTMASNTTTEPTSLTMEELRKITNNFSEDRAIGQGSYGKVYRGVHDNGEEIAVKLLYNNMQAVDGEQFQHEFHNLTMLKHQNIVRLVSYCYETQYQPREFEGRKIFVEETSKALCFEYMHKGSLQKYISDECHGLDWHTRYKIMNGTWEGLKYLHEGFKEPFYHLDLKPDNILLDENMVPKLADFGLSKFFSEGKTRVTQSPIGTIGYLPPEYIHQHLVSNKLDIFSLGVVMIEIIAGPSGHSRSAEMPYQEFIDQVYQNWRNRLEATCSSPGPLEAYCEQVNICIEIALSCMGPDRQKRPNIVDIIDKLNKTETVIDKALSLSGSSLSRMPGDLVKVQAFTRSRAIPGAAKYNEFPIGGAYRSRLNKSMKQLADTDVFVLRPCGQPCTSSDLSIHHQVAPEMVRIRLWKEDNPMEMFEKAAQVFRDDYLGYMETKIHRFPPSLVDVSTRYTVPVTVAIGPYHHHQAGVQQAEKVKHVAAHQCIKDSGASVQEMYDAVFAVAHVARSLYADRDAVAGIGDDDFVPMMFFDACFLVQYIRCYDNVKDMDPGLSRFFLANYERICTDIMMLENQLPWVVVETILGFMPGPSPLVTFIATMKGSLQSRQDLESEGNDMVLDGSYEPPHLLGLIRFYIVGKNYANTDEKLDLLHGVEPVSFSISVIELEEIGITLVAKNAGLMDMGINKGGPLFDELVVAPFFFTEANATWLVNMAAFELCKTPDFDEAQDEDSAVCSYILLFVMLLTRKEDVHQLRTNHVLKGVGMTSKEVLDFFFCLGKNMRPGALYLRTILQIEEYKHNRSIRLKMYLFFNKNWKNILAVVSLIGFLGIFIALIKKGYVTSSIFSPGNFFL